MTNITDHTVAIIPAAGRGTRLLPFTRYLPKEMMPLGDRPIIHHAMAEIQAAKIKTIVLVTAAGKESMVDYLLHHAPDLNQQQLIVVEQQEQKGLGHAVWCSRNALPADTRHLAIIAPDDVLIKKTNGQDLAIGQLLQQAATKPDAMWVAVEKIKPVDSNRYGVLTIGDQQTTDGHVIYRATNLVEKPAMADAPSDVGIIARYLLPHTILAQLDRTAPGAGGEIQLTDAMKGLLPHHAFYGLNTNLARLDTGTIDGLFAANYFYRYGQFPPATI